MNEEDYTDHPAEDVVAWDDIESAAQRMFHVWMGDGEIGWVKECWQHFASDGLTGNTTTLEATSTHVRLLALARIYEQFCGYAWDENPDTPLSYLAEDLTIDPLVLGILAGSGDSQAFDDNIDDDDLNDVALAAATDGMRSQIHTCLVAAYGGSVPLYSRMSKTNRSSEDADDGSEFEVTGPNSSALQFVNDGFPA